MPGLAACTVATEASAHITTTSGWCARGKYGCNGEGKGEDHDNLSHCKRYLKLKTNCLVEELGPGNSEEGIRIMLGRSFSRIEKERLQRIYKVNTKNPFLQACPWGIF